MSKSDVGLYEFLSELGEITVLTNIHGTTVEQTDSASSVPSKEVLAYTTIKIDGDVQQFFREDIHEHPALLEFHERQVLEHSTMRRMELRFYSRQLKKLETTEEVKPLSKS